jgi:hypothetical protein
VLLCVGVCEAQGLLLRVALTLWVKVGLGVLERKIERDTRGELELEAVVELH